ncbi:MAG: hypothetical protein ACPKNR_13220 [Pleomorphochaeta sp.]
MLNYLLYLNYLRFNNFFSSVNLSTFKDLAIILTGVAAITTIVLAFFSLRQYLNITRPNVIPYIDIIKDDEKELDEYNEIKKYNTFVYLKFYNNSEIVAENIGININKEWLNQLQKEEPSSANQLKKLTSYEDIYIIKNHEQAYYICELDAYKKINKIPLKIKITYYSKKGREKSHKNFTINLESIGYKAENCDSELIRDFLKIKELRIINENLSYLTKDIMLKEMHDKLNNKLSEYKNQFGEEFPTFRKLVTKEEIEDRISIINTYLKENTPITGKKENKNEQ